MIKTGVILVLGVVLIAGGLLAGPAQDILGNLADTARAERVVSGLTTIGIGAAVGIGGYLLLDDMGLGTYAAIAGGLVALPGLITLVVPSSSEIACLRSCDSEVDSALALEAMASSARLTRYVSGIVNVAAGTASLLFPYSYVTPYDYVYSAIVSYGMATLDFIFPSKEERAYRQYELAIAGG
ncbi:hypothetical protein ACFLSZ_00205 [Candidatus Bipolaricaulota bacterium]